jgi:hypothetical protein
MRGAIVFRKTTVFFFPSSPPPPSSSSHAIRHINLPFFYRQNFFSIDLYFSVTRTQYKIYTYIKTTLMKIYLSIYVEEASRYF